ncbi:sulfurtransferase [Corynebacterium lubricantis]|uniref:sulfurtransferase n=1 Tax=Corynebacterium lubricantis TaxID=541095 RepID=UPI000363C92B|nr:sulfurtransferase [Corynebacterium lubricantis]
MNSLLSVDEFRRLENPVVFHSSMGPNIPQQVIPGAFIADLEGDFSDPASSLPHTVPATIQQVFASYGISDDTQVVIYDADGATAARVWWLARVAGLSNVALLDGGLRAWVAAGGELTAPSTPTSTGTISAAPRWDLLIDAPEVATTSRTVVDARSHGRFTAAEEEPRPGLRAGHIPGSRNVPFSSLYNEDGTFKSPDELDAIFPDDHLAFSCGSGVTACVTAFAATQAGRSDLVVYEGSWSDWGRPDSGYPVAVGEA